MVQVRYLGTGEAFDDRLPNTSLVFEGGRRLLLDCGYAVPHALWGQSLDPDWLDGIYLSHFHADHCFGLPAVLARMGEDGRTRPLTLLGGPGSREDARRVLELGYPGMLDKVPFPIEHLEIAPGEQRRWGPLVLKTARSLHGMPNHSVRVADGEVAVCYSGDGAPSQTCEELYAGASLLVHEAYHGEPRAKPSHASVPAIVELARRIGIERLHLLHLRRSLVRSPPAVTGATYPKPGEVYWI